MQHFPGEVDVPDVYTVLRGTRVSCTVDVVSMNLSRLIVNANQRRHASTAPVDARNAPACNEHRGPGTVCRAWPWKSARSMGSSVWCLTVLRCGRQEAVGEPGTVG